MEFILENVSEFGAAIVSYGRRIVARAGTESEGYVSREAIPAHALSQIQEL